MTKEDRQARREARAKQVARLEKIKAETVAAVAEGTCPTCLAGLRRNSAITGWWQCEQFGADGFRKDSTKPSCSWQGFTS